MDKTLPRRFSQIYKIDTTLHADSNKFRLRLFAFINEHVNDRSLAKEIKKTLGLEVLYSGGSFGSFRIKEFIQSAEIRDVLDIITITHNLLKNNMHIVTEKRRGYFSENTLPEKFINFVNQCFKEENLHYIVEANGQVHFNPDKEFNSLKISTIRSLENKRYESVAHELSKAYENLDKGEGYRKDAMRNIFTSLEILFRLLCRNENIKNLSATPVEKQFKKIVETIYSSGTNNVIAKLKLQEFKFWVNAAHEYRHGQPIEDLDEPSLELTLLVLSSGAGFIRWLVWVDQEVQKTNSSRSS